MLTRFKSKSSTFFLDGTNTKPFVLDEKSKIDLILSPSFYWVKKLSLPISSLREVKKLLPSIFEDSLPEGHYSYSVYKKEDEFIAFAYEDKKIINAIKDAGIEFSSINNIFFAQSEFESLEGAVSVNETQSMYLKDSLLVLVPTAWLKESVPMKLEGITNSKHTIKLQQFGHIVDNFSLYKIGAILGTFAIILMFEIFITSSKRDNVLEAKEALFSNYKLQSTMFQNKASFKKYLKIHKIQTNLRLTLVYFLNMKYKEGQKITLISLKENKLSITISATPKGSERSILSQLNSKKLKYTQSFSGENMKVEIKL